jgi:hypothetical protein
MIKQVETKEELKELYNNWAMTWEGLREEDHEIAMKECGGEGVVGYNIKGKVMNEICHLTGDNAYPEDLNIFAIYPFKGLAITVGARWMTDIIDNNAHREGYHPFK